MNASTIDGVLRYVGDVWTTTDPRDGTITHTLKMAGDDDTVPVDPSVGLCVVEVQECDAWDGRLVVYDPGRDERS